jgi:hypothetical protein
VLIDFSKNSRKASSFGGNSQLYIIFDDLNAFNFFISLSFVRPLVKTNEIDDLKSLSDIR